MVPFDEGRAFVRCGAERMRRKGVDGHAKRTKGRMPSRRRDRSRDKVAIMKLPLPPIDWPVAAGFDQYKSAQMCAYLLQQSASPMDKLKLIKLVYLTEREFLDRYLMPMTLDDFFSFKDGPVASSTLNGINGLLDQKIWSEWLIRDDRKVSAKRKHDRNTFDHLSNADITVLDAIWKKFGHWSTAKIWAFVHNKDNIPEYTKVLRGRVSIQYEDILRALNKVGADEIAEEIKIMQIEAASL